MNPAGAAGKDPRGQAPARRRDGIRRRDEILDAALGCFARRGLLGTRIEDVRRAAGASPSSVYNLFDGLPSLTAALLARTFERLFAHVTGRVLAEDRADAAVRALVDGHLEWVLGHEDEARFMYGAMALELANDEREELAELKAKLAVPVMGHLASLGTDGALPAWPASTLEFIVLGPAHEACRRYLAGGAVDLAGLRRLLPDVAWQSVSVPLCLAWARYRFCRHRLSAAAFFPAPRRSTRTGRPYCRANIRLIGSTSTNSAGF